MVIRVAQIFYAQMHVNRLIFMHRCTKFYVQMHVTFMYRCTKA